MGNEELEGLPLVQVIEWIISGGLQCTFFNKWRIPFLTPVCGEKHVLKSLLCK